MKRNAEVSIFDDEGDLYVCEDFPFEYIQSLLKTNKLVAGKTYIIQVDDDFQIG